MKLTKQEAFSIVLEELAKVPMFMGTYDATHGSKDFMYGICTVVEWISDQAKPGDYEKYSEIWFDNFSKSLDKAEKV